MTGAPQTPTMKLRSLLSIAVPLLFAVAFLVHKYGISWGISPEHKETTEGLLTGLGLGCLMWWGFVFWKGNKGAQPPAA